jgi:large conductance mechanosensitive channel
LLSFIVIATLVYFFVVVPVNRLMTRFMPEPPPPGLTRECPECLSKIPVKARRCAFCTADISAIAESTVGPSDRASRSST